jgi:multidrug resistance efflux pump
MSRISIFLSAVLLLAPSVHAEESSEITIEKRPFVIRHSITASVMPGTHTPLVLDADAWAEFEITRIAPHGSRVSKGDVLVAFDPEAIDRKIHDTEQSIAAKTLEIAQAELELKNLEETAPHRIAALRRAAAEAKEENAYFTKVRRKAEEEEADQKLKRAESFLENQSEELRQLKKMYDADDLTEETEEIILKRQQDRVEAAEFELRMQRLAHVRSREVLLPRETVTLAEAERDTAIALAKAENESPRAIVGKKLGLENLRTVLARERETLEKLRADRKQFEISAPSDGWFYHGAIENSRWSPGEAAKSLVVHGRPAVRRPFATFIPADAKPGLVAFVDNSIASQLAPDARGLAWITGREDLEFPVKMTSLSSAPDAEGRYKVEFSAEMPKQPVVAPASMVNIHLVTHESPDAIVLPVKALEQGASGWTVAIKLADGKTERRSVKRGRVFNGDCEISSGLEPGQVVVVPQS